MVVKRLREIVGSDYAFDDQETLEEYSKDHSMFPQRRPSFVVKPQNTQEMQEIMRVANKENIPVIVSSSGVHFNGATIPDQGGIVVDLRRMNKILKIDERNRAVRIQPGVSWGQLQEELSKHNLRALNPLLPHSLKSALSSSIEREPMLIPKREYSDPVLTMEVVLPNGEIFRTGSASVGPPDEINTDLVGPSGPGLDFYRLFQGSQGTMCIVTWANIKVPPKPSLEKYIFIPFSDIENVIEPLYKIQHRMLGSECLLLNNFNLALILAENWPDDFSDSRESLPPWTLVLCLAGPQRFPKEKVDYEEEDLMEICQEFGLEPMERLPGLSTSGKEMGKILKQPWTKEPYWKEQYKDRCCDIFFYSTLDRTPKFHNIISEFLTSKGYPITDLGVYIQPLERGHACYIEYDFPWDSKKIGDREKVYTIYRELSELLVNVGAFFARPYGFWSELVYSRNTAFCMTLNKLKEIFDPNHIMNPGRLSL